MLGCAINPGDGTFGDVRLVDTIEDEFVIAGRLEAFNAFWGSVCESFRLSPEEFQVACRQLGYYASGKYKALQTPT